MKPFRIRMIAICIAAFFSLSACGEKKATASVAAKVNGDEISVQQVDFLLQHAKVAPEQSKAVSNQILDKLIDQQLVLQKANEKKLERDPQVLQQIEAAKREILERAYLQQVGADIVKPTEQDIKDYYAKHPELFAERRIYNYRVLAIQAPGDKIPAIRQQIAKARVLEDIVPWLKEQNLRATGTAATRAAEQIPLEALPRFHQLKDGEIGTMMNAGGMEVVQLVSSRSEPVDEAHAKPVIEQFLTSQRGTERARQAVKDLRAAAKIEYRGDFAKPATAVSGMPNSLPMEASAPTAASVDGSATGTKP